MSKGRFVYPPVHEFSTKNTSLLISRFTRGQPAYTIAQLEVTMFVLQVNKACLPL